MAKASPQDQKAYNLVVSQIMEFVTDNGAELEKMINEQGPAKGVAQFIDTAMQGVATAAEQAGVKLQGHTIDNAMQEVVGVIVSIMAASKMIDDPAGIGSQIMQELEGGGQQAAPAPAPAQPQQGGLLNGTA